MNDEKWFKMDAQSSITAYELAIILQCMDIRVTEGVLEKMPKDIRRHFKKEENEYYGA